MKLNLFSLNSLLNKNAGKSHVNAFDGLRGLAVLIVLLSHTSLDGIYLFPGADFGGIGKTGVFLFFILSAYLLDRQIALAFIHSKANYKYWLNYFLRRFLRIYPLFVIGLLVFFAASALGFKSPITSIGSVIEHIFLTRGEGIFWSIAVEFKYYFISPLIMAICNYAFKWDISKTLIFLILLILAAVWVEYKYDLSEISLIRYLPIFLIGTILSITEILLEEKAELSKFKNNTLEVLGFISMALLITTIPNVFNLFFNQNITSYYFHSPVFYLVFSLLWSLVLIAAKYGRVGYLKKFFSLKLMRFLGIISFSVYLFHIPILKVVQIKKLHIPKELQFYAFFIAASAFSYLTYFFIEQPLQKIRIRYEKKD